MLFRSTVELAGGTRAHIFVAALGASSYTFACATPHERMVDWLHGCAEAMRYFGGVAQLIVPDNPRALIANPNRYEPRANDTVQDFARHYGCSVCRRARACRRTRPRWSRPCRWSSAGS